MARYKYRREPNEPGCWICQPGSSKNKELRDKQSRKDFDQQVREAQTKGTTMTET